MDVRHDSLYISINTYHSELLHQDVVIAATALRPQNGVEAPMVPERCAMLVDSVSPTPVYTYCSYINHHADYAKLTRKMGGKQAMTSSNLRPKSLDHGSPAV